MCPETANAFNFIAQVLETHVTCNGPDRDKIRGAMIQIKNILEAQGEAQDAAKPQNVTQLDKKDRSAKESAHS